MAREWESKVAEKAGTKEGFMDRTEGRRLVLPARSLEEVSHYQVITHNLRYNDIDDCEDAPLHLLTVMEQATGNRRQFLPKVFAAHCTISVS